MKPEDPARRFILVAIARISSSDLRYNIMSEADGPNEIDCPMRILKAAELYPPHNEHAAPWRKECRRPHEEIRQFNSILRQVEQHQENADRRILIHDGRVVYYQKARSRRQNVRAYHEQGQGQLYRLNMRAVDVTGTIAMHRTPQADAA